MHAQTFNLSSNQRVCRIQQQHASVIQGHYTVRRVTTATDGCTRKKLAATERSCVPFSEGFFCQNDPEELTPQAEVFSLFCLHVTLCAYL